MSKRPASVFAATVEVTCPNCQESVPAPGNGSFLWTLEELRKADGEERVCDSCDDAMVIVNHSRAQIVNKPPLTEVADEP